MAELESSFGSNTCRCTGFRPILDTMKSFASDASPQLRQMVRDMEDLNVGKTQCCKGSCAGEMKCFEDKDDLIDDFVQVENTVTFDFGNSKYIKVFDVNDAFDILSKHKSDSYMFMDGNTGKGVQDNFEYPRILIDISGICSLKTFRLDQNMILGANVCLEDCIAIFKDISQRAQEFSYLKEFVKHFDLIAHIPVRKLGSLAGNLMLKHANPAYQSDVFLLFESVGAVLTIRDSNGLTQTMGLLEFLQYDMNRKMILSIALPPMGQQSVFGSYKIMPRNQNALAIVNAAFNLKLNNNVIEEARLVFGNISANFTHATNTEEYLIGKNIYNNSVLQEAVKILNNEIAPVEHPPEPSPECRKKLAVGLFYKFVLNNAPVGVVNDIYQSGGPIFDRPVSKGSQDYQTNPSLYPLNQPLPKLEAQIQSSGEAHYANDLPPSPNDVFGAFVLSTVHNGEVSSINIDEALATEGVLAIYTADDIPGINSFTYPGLQLLSENEEILATKIKYYGQPIAILVATSEELAVSEAKKVKVQYKNVPCTPPVLTIDAAKRDSSRYIPDEVSIVPTGKGNNVKTVVKGIYEIEAQYHYYMEPLTCVAVPVDKGLEVYDSTQWIDLCQVVIAKCLNRKESDITVIVRRVGGGFGGKISRNAQVATAAALVAHKMDKTCRFVLPLQTNLTIAGRRVPTQCDYEAGVDEDGMIQYLNASIIQNVGCSLNDPLLLYVAGGFPNCYNKDYFSLKTASVLTDLPSNTFFRAPGTAEGMASIEHIMEHIAFSVKKDSLSVRLANIQANTEIRSLIDTVRMKSNYNKRVKEIKLFNENNRWIKRAKTISVMRFPIEYYGNYSALVTIYRGDGTVSVTTGGIEMGQGSNTKAAQVCAYELGIPLESVSIVPNYSFTAANNVFSGSSITSECICYSIIKACRMLKERLAPLKAQMPDATWQELVMKAGDEEIDLSATYMMTDKEPELKNYDALAVVALEVTLDVLTGRFQIDRVDFLEDVGLSANPTIDVGQVEGAYVQGLGYFTCEKLVFDPVTGKLLTNRSLSYHVPLARDIPLDFRVNMRYNSRNPNGVLGSKTCGEMGITTANGITHALRMCIMESRKHSYGCDESQWLNISVPYDTESILKALGVKLEELVLA